MVPEARLTVIWMSGGMVKDLVLQVLNMSLDLILATLTEMTSPEKTIKFLVVKSLKGGLQANKKILAYDISKSPVTQPIGTVINFPPASSAEQTKSTGIQDELTKFTGIQFPHNSPQIQVNFLVIQKNV